MQILYNMKILVTGGAGFIGSLSSMYSTSSIQVINLNRYYAGNLDNLYIAKSKHYGH